MGCWGLLGVAGGCWDDDITNVMIGIILRLTAVSCYLKGIQSAAFLGFSRQDQLGRSKKVSRLNRLK